MTDRTQEGSDDPAPETRASRDSDPESGPGPASRRFPEADSVPGSRRLVRTVLGIGVVLGVVSLVATHLRQAYMLGINLEVYYYTARALLEGGPLYGTTPPDPPGPGYYFLYPPAVALVFLPYGLFPSPAVPFAVQTLLQVGVGLAFARLLVRAIERRGVEMHATDSALVGGFVVCGVHTVPTLYYGNINLFLAAALGAGLAWVERHPTRAGILLAVPAVVKAFPAAVGVWLLRVRARRSIASAVGVGTGVLGVGLAAFGVDSHRTYVREALLGRLDPGQYAGGLDPTLPRITVRRPLSVLFPAAEPWMLTLGAGLFVIPVVWYCYLDVETDLDRLVAAYATVVCILVFFPSYFVYVPLVLFPLVPLVYLLEGEWERRLFGLGAGVLNVPLHLGTVENVAAALPAAVADPLVRAATIPLTFGSTPLYGFVLTLAGCVVYRYRRTGVPAVADLAGESEGEVAD